MQYISPKDRNQRSMLPESIEDYVTIDSEVRIIEAFVEKMSEEDGLLKMGFKRSGELATSQGRPQYSSKLLIKIYVYGYLHHINTSRRLEWLTRTNIEMKWLLGDLTPDHKTISDFRKDNKSGLKKFFKVFILFLKDNDLIDGKLVAIDGSKVKANTNKDMYSIKKLDQAIQNADKEIEEYLTKLDEADKADNRKNRYKIKSENIGEKIARIKSKIQGYENIKEEMIKRDKKYMGKTDKECSLMKSRDGKIPAYNNQMVVDSKNNMIIATEATASETDAKQINPMIDKAIENIREIESVVADNGYYEEEDILKAGKKVNLFVAMNSKTAEKAPGFKYDEKSDKYICPSEKELLYKNNKVKKGKKYRVYQSSSCNGCSRLDACTTSVHGRQINRYINENEIEIFRQKMNGTKGIKIMKKRKEIIEHVFGSMKLMLGKIPLLTRGINNINNELILFSTAYNFRRMLNVLSFDEIMRRIDGWKFRLV